MNTTPQMAAQAWAHAHANRFSDPVEFGHKVAQVEAAAKLTAYHAGDDALTAASLAALSVRPEVLQVIAQLASLCPRLPVGSTPTGSSGAEA